MFIIRALYLRLNKRTIQLVSPHSYFLVLIKKKRTEMQLFSLACIGYLNITTLCFIRYYPLSRSKSLVSRVSKPL